MVETDGAKLGMGAPVEVAASKARAYAASTAFVEPLALPGVVIVVFYLAAIAMGRAGVRSEPFKFTEYGLIGITLALTLVALANADTWPAICRRWVIGIAAGIALAACAEYSLIATDAFCLLCASAQLAFAIGRGWLRPVPGQARAVAGAAVFLLSLASWTTAIHLPWWTDFSYLRMVVPYFRFTFLAVLAIVLIVTYPINGISNAKDGLRARIAPLAAAFSRCVDAGVLALMALASLRTAGLLNVDPRHWQSFHHWGVFVAPVEMVRQGGWLLWDVPSQYGFLSILFLSALPCHSVWTELHVVIAVFQTAAAFLLYGCLRFCLNRPLGRLAAASVSIGAVFIMPCYGIVFGPQVMPSTTAFRFVWVYVVLGSLASIARTRTRCVAEGRRIDIRPLAAGCVAWALGVFWSYESAYWVSAVWVPAYGVILWQEWKRGMDRRRLLFLSILPASVLAFGIGVTEIVYWIGRHPGPDWSCFGEYVHAFSHGFGEWGMNYQGPIWVVFICCILPAAAALAVFRKSRLDAAVPVLVGASAAVFAVASYCIGRSVVNNILNILTICLIGAALVLRMGPRVKSDSSLMLMARTCVVPLLSVAISGSIAVPGMMRGWLAGTLHPGPIALDSRLPRFDPEADALLTRAHVDAVTPLAVYDLNLPRTVADARAELDRPYWLPISPGGAVTPLAPERAAIYMDRFLRRTDRGGWLLIPSHADFEGFDMPWFLPSVHKFYVPTKTFTSANYTLTYYEPRRQWAPRKSSAKS